MNFKYEPQNNKKLVAYGLIGIAVIVEAVSFAANYSIMFQSFAGWPVPLQRLLGFTSAAVVEIAVLVMLVGLLEVFESSSEMLIAGITLAMLVGVMATNFIISGHVSQGVNLDGFELAWLSWVGKLSLFAVLGSTLLLILFNPAAISRRKARELAGKIADARNQAYSQVLQSDEFQKQMEARMKAFAVEISAEVLPGNLLTSAHPQPHLPNASVQPSGSHSSGLINGATTWSGSSAHPKT